MNRNQYLYFGLIILIYLVFNPFIALFFSIYLNKKIKLINNLNLFFFSFSFAYLFFSREIGVNFYEYATDDVEVYVEFYKSVSATNFSVLFNNFFTNPSGNEPIYLIFIKLLNFISFQNISVFIFLHYFILFYLLYFLVKKISVRYAPLLILFYFFTFPISLYSIAHVWRQQIAIFLFFILVMYRNNIKNKYIFHILLFSTVFIHLSNIYFFLIYIFYHFSIKFLKETPKNVIIISLILMTIEKIIFTLFLILLSLLGLDKLLTYTDGLSANKDVFFKLLPIYLSLTIMVLFLNKKNVNLFTLTFFTLSALLMPIVIPSLNSIYDRFINFTIPLIGVLFVAYFINNKMYRFIPILSIIIFLIGSLRLFLEYKNNVGIISFIGYKHGFDPFLGIIKLFVLNI